MTLLLDRDDRAAPPPPDRPPASQRVAEDDAGAFLADLRSGLLAGDRPRLAGMGASRNADHELITLSANLDRLRVTDLRLRYVDESELRLTGPERRRFGPDAWVADVRLGWRFRGVDRALSALEVPLVLTSDGAEPAFVTARVTGDRRVPLWWQTRVAARRTATTLVVATEAERLRTLSRQAARAAATVRGALGSWRDALVVEAARTTQEFRRATGVSAVDAGALAAVTATTGRSETPAHVYLNSPLFDVLGPQGQQIIVTHEAVHVALDAAGSSVPLWLSEGIADHVALADTTVPVRILASQIRRLVRDQGPPAALPSRKELDGGNPDVGAWYEAAWLAADLVAELHGEAALLELYREVDEHGDTGRAFRDVLGTTEAAFVEAWRDRLRTLAD